MTDFLDTFSSGSTFSGRTSDSGHTYSEYWPDTGFTRPLISGGVVKLETILGHEELGVYSSYLLPENVTVEIEAYLDPAINNEYEDLYLMLGSEDGDTDTYLSIHKLSYGMSFTTPSGHKAAATWTTGTLLIKYVATATTESFYLNGTLVVTGARTAVMLPSQVFGYFVQKRFSAAGPTYLSISSIAASGTSASGPFWTEFTKTGEVFA